jgi:hypothetical protein
VSDIGEGAAVDQGGRAFHRLHEIGVDGVTEQRGHGAGDAQRVRGHRLAVPGERHHHPAQPLLEIVHASARQSAAMISEAAVMRKPPSGARRPCARPVPHHLPQRAVIDVQRPLPEHLAHVDASALP